MLCLILAANEGLHNKPLDLAKIMLSATFVDCFTTDMVTLASGVWVTCFCNSHIRGRGFLLSLSLLLEPQN